MKWLTKHDILNKEQTGFRKGNSVIDNIMLLKEVMQIYKNQKRSLFICFVDLSKAFDSIPIERLKMKLRRILPNKSHMLSIICQMLDRKEYQVLYNGQQTVSFKLNRGVPQGDCLSPTLFSLCINDLINILKKRESLTDPVEIDS